MKPSKRLEERLFNKLVYSLKNYPEDWNLTSFTLDNDKLGIEVWVDLEISNLFIGYKSPFIFRPHEMKFSWIKTLRLRHIMKKIVKDKERKRKKEIQLECIKNFQKYETYYGD